MGDLFAVETSRFSSDAIKNGEKKRLFSACQGNGLIKMFDKCQRIVTSILKVSEPLQWLLFIFQELGLNAMI